MGDMHEPRWGRYLTEADLPAVLGPAERNEAILTMLQTGGFEDTPALARWSETDEAQPILREFMILRIKPLPTDYFSIDLEAARREVAEQDALAADIEARFG